jgi:outer membrane immunogenic protein
VFRSIIVTIATLALGSAAIAADLPSIKSAPVPASASTWTGLYAGLNAGGTWVNNNNLNTTTQLLIPSPDTASLFTAKVLSGPRYLSNSLGFIGGAQIGYNWQVPVNGFEIVAGVESDIQGVAGANGSLNFWSNNANAHYGTANFPNFDNNGYSNTTNIQSNSSLNWLGTVRGRLGYLFTPSLLIYGTGGLAYGGYDLCIKNFIKSEDIEPDTDYHFLVSGRSGNPKTMVGWAAGGGSEWMFLPNWSLKTEYLFYDLGTTGNMFFNDAYGYADAAGIFSRVSVTNFSQRVNGNIVRAGMNYHFNFANAAPVVAKY